MVRLSYRERYTFQFTWLDMFVLMVLNVTQETEMLCILLLMQGYLKQEHVPNAHKLNLYLVPGDKARRLTNLVHSDIVEKGLGPNLESVFPVVSKQKIAVAKDGVPAGSKRKRVAVPPRDGHDEAVPQDAMGGAVYSRSREGHGGMSPIVIDDSEEGEGDDVKGAVDSIDGDEGDIEDEDGSEDWSYSLRSDRPQKKTRSQAYVEILVRRPPVDNSVISIDSD